MQQSTSIVNFEELLAPISGEHPTGIDLREDESPSSAYFQLKDARNAARADERNQASKPENERESSKHWSTILELAPRILSNQSKDLEVATWYVEALVRKYELAGLRDGLTLLNNLISAYWTDLYPTIDEDGIATKIAPLAGLFGLSSAGSLAQPINCIMVTDPKQNPKFAAWQYQQAVALKRAPDAKARNARIQSGVPTIEVIETAAKKAPNAFYQTLDRELKECRETFDTLFVQLDSLCGDAVPNGSSVRHALDNINEAIRTIAKHALNIPEATATSLLDTENMSDDADSIVSGGSLSANNIKQREEAFATIQIIADFFRKAEPHSPISYALERIVKWGGMQLPELLKELVEDKMAFDAYCKLTGIEIPQLPVPSYPQGAPMGYHDPMGQQQMQHNPMGMGGYPPPPAPGGPMGNSMFNDTF